MSRFLLGATLALSLPALSFSADAAGDPLPPGAVARIGTTRLRHAAEVSSLAFSPDGRRISSATIWFDTAVWDARTGRALAFRSSRRQEGLFRAVVSPDGSLFAGRTDDGKLGVQEALSGKFLHRFLGKKEPCAGLVFSRDNRWLASADDGGNTYLWDLRAGKLAHQLAVKPRDSVEDYHHAFTPDGTGFIQARAAGITLWDVRTGKEIRCIESRKMEGEWAGGVAVSPDGKLLAAHIAYGRIDLWEIKTGRLVRTIGEKRNDVGPVFSPDGKYIVTGRETGEIDFWEVETGERARSLEMPAEGHPTSLAFSADGKLLAAGCSDHAIRIWDLASRKELLPGNHRLGGTPSVRFLSDGKTLLVHCRYDVNDKYATIDERPSFWDLRGRLLRQVWLASEKAHAWALSGDARTVAHGSGPNFGFMFRPVLNEDLKSDICLCDATSGKQLVEVDGLPCQIHELAFSPDDRFLLVNASNAGPHKDGYNRVDVLQIWKRKSPSRLDKVTDIPVRSFLSGWCVSPDSRWAVVTSQRGYRFHDCETGKLIRSHPNAPGSVVAVSPSGRVLVSRVGDDARTGKVVLVWEKATGKPICKLSCEPGETDWAPLVVSPDGRVIAGCLDREVIALWDAFTGKQLAKLEGHRGDISSLAFSPDGQHLVSASADTTVLVWDWKKELPKTPGNVEWSAERLEQLWQDLQASDPRRAYLAINALLRSPGQAIDLVRRKSRPVSPDARIERWIEELDSDRYEVREKAMKELTASADHAQDALRRALATPLDLEARRRVKLLLDRLPGAALHPSTLATIRSLELLEMIDTPEACKLVQEISRGLSCPMPRREAEETLQRLKRRSPERDRIQPPPRRPHP